MLYFTLALSSILLIVANLAVHRKHWWQAYLFCGLAFSFGTFCWGFFLHSVALLFLLLSVAMLPWCFARPRPWFYLPLSGLAVVIVGGIVGRIVLATEREYADLRGQFPYESLEERLPPPRPAFQVGSVPDPMDRRLGAMESRLLEFARFPRSQVLRQLHEHTWILFINSPGFGVTRMRYPKMDRLTLGQPSDAPVPQPVPSAQPQLPEPDLAWTPRSFDGTLLEMHQAGVLDFVNPWGFGFVKDRRHVAGFRPHQFTSLPDAQGPWVLRRVDLVSLLIHEEPCVYVSDHLPSMKDVRGAPARPLDAFEASALARLVQGEDLVLESAGADLRMLGSIRSLDACGRCHLGQRGDLLGAFSYSLKQAAR